MVAGAAFGIVAEIVVVQLFVVGLLDGDLMYEALPEWAWWLATGTWGMAVGGLLALRAALRGAARRAGAAPRGARVSDTTEGVWDRLLRHLLADRPRRARGDLGAGRLLRDPLPGARRRRGRVPHGHRREDPGRVALRSGLALVAAFLVFLTLTGNSDLNAQFDEPRTSTSRSSPRSWNWRFEYPESGSSSRGRATTSRRSPYPPASRSTSGHFARRGPQLLDPGRALQARRLPASRTRTGS